jgi:hypothetical protein
LSAGVSGPYTCTQIQRKKNNYIHETDTQNSTKTQHTKQKARHTKQENKHINNNKRHKHKNINIRQSLRYNKELKDYKANNYKIKIKMKKYTSH